MTNTCLKLEQISRALSLITTINFNLLFWRPARVCSRSSLGIRVCPWGILGSGVLAILILSSSSHCFWRSFRLQINHIHNFQPRRWFEVLTKQRWNINHLQTSLQLKQILLNYYKTFVIVLICDPNSKTKFPQVIYQYPWIQKKKCSLQYKHLIRAS